MYESRRYSQSYEYIHTIQSVIVNMTEITLEFLQDLLKEEYPDVTLQEFEGAPGSKRGDNYTSMVYRITLTGVKRQKSDDSTIKEILWQGSVIYKCLPESIARREAFKSDELFCNEVAFYNKIWPALSKYQSQWTIQKPFESIPTCYLARNDCVVLKDLKQYGFVMPNRKEGLSVEQTYVLLEQLAHFHALSLAMKWHDPKEFYELINAKDGISEVFFVSENIDYYKDYYNEAIRNAIAMVEEELRDSTEKDIYVEKFRKFCSEDTFFQTMLDLVAPSEPLGLICHGDCWTNNFLFRYEEGVVVEMNIVDFQMVRYASPMLDLVYVMYLCLDRRQRSEHLSNFFKYYAEKLHSRVCELSRPDTLSHSLDKDSLLDLLQEEFKQKSLFGLGIALDMYPIMTCDSNEAPNLYQSEDNESTSGVQPVWTSNAACRRKMTDLVQELVDEGIL